MRRTRFATIVILLFANVVPASASDMAPEFSLESSTGENVTLSQEVKEQTTVLFFWATWCPYCKALMPHLQSIRLEYGDDVKILAINFREDGEPVKYIEDAGYDFTVLPDGDAVAASYGVHATPGLIVVDRDRQNRFDLRKLPRRELPADSKQASSHKRKAAYRAPYWAAALRESIDDVKGVSNR
ncbi:MAG: TlpA family protein disulfide reductase [Woeseiaceae bacterium]